MTESKITREIAKLACIFIKIDLILRRMRSEIQYLKHSDRFTKGIPDATFTVNGVTTWFEFKLASNKNIFEPAQIGLLKKLVRAHLVIWDAKLRLGDVIPNESLGVRNQIICNLNKKQLAYEIAKLSVR